MRDLGYVEGRDFVVEWRFAEGQYDRLTGYAQELVRLKVDVIVAFNTRAASEAQRATSTIPIVFASISDPVGSGLVVNDHRNQSRCDHVKLSRAGCGFRGWF
jgi:putative ABC transport system substrate-binding protein